MSEFDYDLFVIGGGSGGVRAARIAAGHGAKVAIAEEYRFGGTCVIRGCVPKKLLVYASRFRDDFEDAAGFGWSVSPPSFDWPTLIANKDAEIARLEGLYRSGLERAGVTIMQARAELADAHTLTVQPGNRKVTARNILVATGGRPVGARVAGRRARHHLQRGVPSREPARSRILIVGGGYIAVEFAGIFNGLGVETTLVYRGAKILRGFDEELRDGLTEELFKRGIDIVCNADIAAIDKGWTHSTVTLKDGSTVETGKVMFATGRAPNTQGARPRGGRREAGRERRDRGRRVLALLGREHLRRRRRHRPRQPDARRHPRGPRLRRHRVRQQADGRRSRAGADRRVLTPEIGTVGLPEARGARALPRARHLQGPLPPLKHTLSGRDERMFMKLLVDGDSDRVVGCHVLGADAAEIVQMAAIAMRLGATKADFDATMALHPSAAEELVTMREKWVPPAKAAAAKRPSERRRPHAAS